MPRDGAGNAAAALGGDGDRQGLDHRANFAPEHALALEFPGPTQTCFVGAKQIRLSASFLQFGGHHIPDQRRYRFERLAVGHVVVEQGMLDHRLLPPRQIVQLEDSGLECLDGLFRLRHGSLSTLSCF